MKSEVSQETLLAGRGESWCRIDEPPSSAESPVERWQAPDFEGDGHARGIGVAKQAFADEAEQLQGGYGMEDPAVLNSGSP